MVDHSLTYKVRNLKNLPHFLRLKKILSTVDKLCPNSPFNYFDVGCSNGFITNIVSGRLNPDDACGFDHSIDNLLVAGQTYSKIKFTEIDLNSELNIDAKADLVTCLETLEHVGNLDVAIKNLAKLCKETGHVLVTVPIEIGGIGIAKFFVKTLIYRYNFKEFGSEDVSWWAYFSALRRGKIADFRRCFPREHWGTHFGFDYHEAEEKMRGSFGQVESFVFFTTRFIIASRPLV